MWGCLPLHTLVTLWLLLFGRLLAAGAIMVIHKVKRGGATDVRSGAPMEVHALPFLVAFVPHARLLRLVGVCVARSVCEPNISNLLVFYLGNTHLSMNCVSRTYAMHAESSPSRCTCGFRMVVLIALQFFPRTSLRITLFSRSKLVIYRSIPIPFSK